MIVHLKGGLGNQMFEYAFGRSVAYDRGEKVQFTRTHVDSDPRRCYGLGVFDPQIEFAPGGLEAPVYNENPYSFNPSVYTVQARSFDGQWQTEKYFTNHRSMVMNAFFRRYDKMSEASLRWANGIARGPSAFIHHRRSDYVQGDNPQWHTNLQDDYYDAASNYILERVERVNWFIFSDDPEWCRNRWPEAVIIDCNKPGGRYFGKDTPGDEHQDLWLMSMCDHAIIANSSFSWWGAWLGGVREGRVIVAPKNWFGPRLNYLDTSDIVPERWTKL